MKNRFDDLIVGTMRWGSWGARLDTRSMTELLESVVEMGYSWFDHADIYGGYTTEEEFGLALEASAVRRKDINIITKCGICYPADERTKYELKHYNTSSEYIQNQAIRSIEKLRCDYLDLLLIHRPDPLMDIYEIETAFESLKTKGLVRAFGVSNFTPTQFQILNGVHPLSTNQVEASVLHLDPFVDGTFLQCQRQRVRPQIWSPLGGGALFHTELTEQGKRLNKILAQLQEKYDQPIANIMLRFILDHPSRPAIVLGSAKEKRLREMRDCLSFSLNREDWFRIWTASTGKKVP